MPAGAHVLHRLARVCRGGGAKAPVAPATLFPSKISLGRSVRRHDHQDGAVVLPGAVEDLVPESAAVAHLVIFPIIERIVLGIRGLSGLDGLRDLDGLGYLRGLRGLGGLRDLPGLLLHLRCLLEGHLLFLFDDGDRTCAVGAEVLNEYR